MTKKQKLAKKQYMKKWYATHRAWLKAYRRLPARMAKHAARELARYHAMTKAQKKKKAARHRIWAAKYRAAHPRTKAQKAKHAARQREYNRTHRAEQAAYSRRYGRVHRVERLEYARTRAATRREMFYSGGCIDPGPHGGRLERHHRDPAKKLFNISTALCMSLTVLRPEVKKTDLICAKCHAKRHINLRALKRAA